MQDAQDYFKGKNIILMRIGLLGRGVGDAAFLAGSGAEVLVVDDAPQDVMQPSVDALKGYENITFKFGPYDEKDFTSCDMVLVGAGAPYDLPCLQAAKDAGVPLRQSAALFAELSKVPIIGVTGTRGKSTVTHMIHHILTHSTQGAPVLLGGNIRGVSNLQLLKDVHEDSVAVMELDSWQLQGFGYSEISPHIAVFTNFMDDHMNYYHGDMDRYFEDKANIFRYQEESGVFITTPEVFKRAEAFAKGKNVTLGQEVVLVDASVLPEDMLLSMPGEHNRLNAALAYEALRATSLPDDLIFEGLATFPGVSGRLELLREVNGIKIYNDNNATTPEALIAGLEALDPDGKQNILLICGGADKGFSDSVAGIREAVHAHARDAFFLAGTGTDRVKKQNEKVYDSLDEALAAAYAAASAGDIILFSPGFASFGMFKNEYVRNDQFVELVSKL
jgi:UDP-N-acetylmuramoylalanine--D-glutamate ligase